MGFRVDVYLKDTVTGVAGVHHDAYEFPDEYGVECAWLIGNFGCDCNRADDLYLDAVPDAPWPFPTENAPCGYVGWKNNRIVAEQIVRLDTGKVLVRNDVWVAEE